MEVRLALDTNQAIALLNSRADLDHWLNSYSEIWLPIIVMGELCFGAEKSSRREDNLSRIEDLCRICRLAPVDEEVARTYAQIRSRLRSEGTPIPENDVWIAAVCVANGFTLATSDKHFDFVTNLKILRS